MRKAIFKQEIEYLFLHYSIADSKRWDVRKALFKNPMDGTKLYLLKEEIPSCADLDKHLTESGVSNDDFIVAVRSLFTVTDDLELPDSLREQLVRKEKIAIFCGAGVSKLLGIPLWEELARQAIDYLHEIGRLNFAEAERIIGEPTTPKQKMSYFHALCPKGEPASREFYRKYLEPDKILACRKNPYDFLVRLEVPKLTTNLDHEFWHALQRKPKSGGGGISPVTVVEPKPARVDFDFQQTMPVDTNAIYQVHGSYQNLEKYSVITMRDYIFRYFENLDLRGFLKKIFKEYVVIFIGHGMQEFEILQDVVRDTKRHHVLLGAYLNDPNLLGVRRQYFESLGINAHGYYLDFEGHNRLCEVIESWVEKIDAELSGGFYRKVSELGNVEL